VNPPIPARAQLPHDDGVDGDAAKQLAEGQRALAEGDWAAARVHFEQATPGGSAAEALDGLAQTMFMQGDYTGAIDHGEKAFAAYRSRADDARAQVRAAMCARSVGYLYGVVHGNGAAAGGWMGRAVRLIEAAGDCAERARIELTRAVLTEDSVAREGHLSDAVEIAQRYGDTDIVFDAMSQRGLHLVAAGDVDAGMALLDEALAAIAAGEVRDLVSVGAMYCKMLHACELTFDVRRATDWLAIADRFVEQTNRIPISAICRTHYGGVLTAAGRWTDAERELLTSLELYDRSYRALRTAALVRLADLRVRQGRLAEAAQLLIGSEHDRYAVRPHIELHLARGEVELAAARAERFLREHGESELTAPVLHLLVRAYLARDDHDAAATTATRLRELAAARQSRLLTAIAEHTAGLVAATLKDPGATTQLENALAAFGRLELPLEEARARLDLATVLATQRPTLALAEARTALGCFQTLSATRDADAAMSLLRHLGVHGHSGSRGHRPRGDGRLTPREQEVLELLGHGLTNADIAARLYVSRRTIEHHVSNILAKLGLHTRAEATAYIARRPAHKEH
jgi:DNA-binding CsgD family transcriptional regulator